MNKILLALQAAAGAYAFYNALRGDDDRTPEHLQMVSAAADAAARATALYETMRQQAARTHQLTDAESVDLDRRANEIFATAAANKSGR